MNQPFERFRITRKLVDTPLGAAKSTGQLLKIDDSRITLFTALTRKLDGDKINTRDSFGGKLP
jgi:hypothetical protein